MTEDYTHRWERPGATNESTQPQVTSTPTQVLTGLQVGLPSLEVICEDCGHTLQEGADLGVYAYRPAEYPQWGLCRCYCSACTPHRITTPTLGTAEAIVTAEVVVVSRPSSRDHRLCLGEVSLVAFAPPSVGADP